jgi:hypothetical protein
MYKRQARIPPEAWNLFTHILNKRYYEFSERNKLDEGEIPIIKIGFYRKLKNPPKQLEAISLLETKKVKINTILETKKYNVTRSTKLKTDKNRKMYEEEKMKLKEDNEEKNMLLMMNSIMNDYSCLTTYDVIEEQILYEEVSRVTLPIEYVFEEDIKTITSEFGCQTDNEDNYHDIKKELEDVLQMTSLSTSPSDIKTLSKHHLIVSFLTNFKKKLSEILLDRITKIEDHEMKVDKNDANKNKDNRVLFFLS